MRAYDLIISPQDDLEFLRNQKRWGRRYVCLKRCGVHEENPEFAVFWCSPHGQTCIIYSSLDQIEAKKAAGTLKWEAMTADAAISFGWLVD